MTKEGSKILSFLFLDWPRNVLSSFIPLQKSARLEIFVSLWIRIVWPTVAIYHPNFAEDFILKYWECTLHNCYCNFWGSLKKTLHRNIFPNVGSNLTVISLFLLNPDRLRIYIKKVQKLLFEAFLGSVFTLCFKSDFMVLKQELLSVWSKGSRKVKYWGLDLCSLVLSEASLGLNSSFHNI